MLKIVQEGSDANETGASMLDEIVRDGARQMLAAALLAEVAAHVEAMSDQVDAEGRLLVVRKRVPSAAKGDHGGRRGPGAAAAGERQAHR